LTSMDVYVPKLETDVSSMLNTPTPHTLLLVPSSIGLLDPEAIFAIGVKTRECMLGWAEGLRFYKHGQRRLSENLEAALSARYRHQNQTAGKNGEEHVYSQIQQIQNSRGFEDKRYKLAFRSERFATLNDLSRFYEDRRHLLVGYNGNHSLESSHLRTDPATAF
uniref:SAM-dependent methyltransferase n=1 Tax=Taenia asiatica TaxID=60517 RepID=A0A0R3WF38_TAEAS